MAYLTRNEGNLRRDNSLKGAPLFRARYRCTLCDNPIEQTFAGPQGKCWPCLYGNQDIRPQSRIEAVGIYYPKKDWGKVQGPVIDELEAFSKEILEAKDQNRTGKMVEILAYGIETSGFESFDTIVIPPSSSEPNHMVPKAKDIEEKFNIGFENAIVEIEDTGEFKNKNAEQRRESAEDNYFCQADLQDERVILLDDIVTTTNTSTEVAAAIKARGANQIVTVSMCRSVDLYDLKKTNLVVEKS